MSLTYQPFADPPLLEKLSQNFGPASQAASQSFGMILIANAFRRRGLSKWALLLAGGFLCWRAYSRAKRRGSFLR